MPDTMTPAVVFAHHLQGRIVAHHAGIDFAIADAGRRRHREREVEVVAARALVETHQIVAEARREAVEQFRPHRQPGDEPRNMVGRAPDQPIGRVRDRLHGAHAAREILARAAAQPLHAEAVAIFLDGEQLAFCRIGLEIVQRRNRARAVAERGMAGDVVDALRADIDDAAVAHAIRAFRCR